VAVTIPEGRMQKALELAMQVDRSREKSYVTKLRRDHPQESNRQLADRIIRNAKWFGVAVGGATGIPGNPWAALPLALGDYIVVFRKEVVMACRIALLYDPTYFDDDETPWELLVPIYGASAGSQFLREGAVLGSAGVTRIAIRQYLSKGTLRSFKRIMLKYFGLKVTQRGLITKSVPVVGGIIGAGWNYNEVRIIGQRVINFMDGDNIKADADDVDEQ